MIISRKRVYYGKFQWIPKPNETVFEVQQLQIASRAVEMRATPNDGLVY